MSRLNLQVGWKLRVDGQNGDGSDIVADLLKPLGHDCASDLNVFLASHKDKDVAWRLR